MMRKVGILLLAALALPALALADAIPTGWTCTGNCGSSGADGVVLLSPAGNSSYEWVSTASGSTGVGALPSGALGSETNGSTLMSPTFSATAGNPLNFYFDYVTSDGAGYADYGWAGLFDAGTDKLVALLFTARTVPSPGNIVPGTGMPPPAATLIPSTVAILAGTNWSPLGFYSGMCWSAGCGNSGWVATSYTIASAGNYYVEIGTVNWADIAYDSGLAMDGLTVAGVPVGGGGGTSVPEPPMLPMLGLGLAGLALLRKRFAVSSARLA